MFDELVYELQRFTRIKLKVTSAIQTGTYYQSLLPTNASGSGEVCSEMAD